MIKQFVPIAIIDARNCNTKQVIGAAISLIKQTYPPAAIKIVINNHSHVDFDTLQTMIFSHDGAKISLSRLVVSETEGEYDIVTIFRNITSITGTHRQNKRPRKFKVTHVILLRAWHRFMSYKVIEKLMEEWNNNVYYDVMLFKQRSGRIDYRHRSAIFYLESVKTLCRYDLWSPFIKKQGIIDAVKSHVTTNFLPIRFCPYGIVADSA